jgi:hypothetical protein
MTTNEHESETSVLDEPEVSPEAPLLSGDLDTLDEQQRAKAMKEDRERRESIASDFRRLLHTGFELAKLTSNPIYLNYFEHLSSSLQRHKEGALIIDQSTKELIAHQQGVHLIRELQEFILAPLDRFNEFVARQDSGLLKELGLTARMEYDDTTGQVAVIGLTYDQLPSNAQEVI